ncbi:hypothetical protein N7474_006058 [Penicillium riverlandense]|uniref:uncharacterized protein n=1 Tax=Penicillium riverlandense TaxID=1903569 RepID=UPI0025472D10|nr:uncharacterized protein N7474_006058 [Penicillium riverlandense]KAJ5820467.1 hypothetical protein N7474_006058 [Penicillium riverlandense]
MNLILSAILPAFATAALASPSVTIDAGTLQGGQCENTQNAVYYKAIPYAEPPVGDLRFEPPKAYNKHYPNGKLDATTAPASCIQFGAEFDATGALSEDCLYLDVWTPSDATKDSNLPVKVWIYGGSDTSGGISKGLFDGCNTAADGSILVSINYRLGPLGFMALNSAGIYGNQGIQDLLLGLEWVQDNIAAFGGDPNKVLLFGQSAGAEDAFIIASLPQAPSFFNSVIMESGAGKRLLHNSTIQSVGASYAQTLKCSSDDKACLQSRTVSDLRKAYNGDTFLHEGIGAGGALAITTSGTHAFYPYVDGNVIPEEPLSRGVQVPAVFGSNKNEGVIYAAATVKSLSNGKSLTPSLYKSFLRNNFGSAAGIIEKYYPLSMFEALAGGNAHYGVLYAIAQVITDADYKCVAYEGLVSAALNNIPVWTYEYTHNNTCPWLGTLKQLQGHPEEMALVGATHTAEIPFVFGNMNNQPLPGGTCNATEDEDNLSKQMMSLWTAMAENADPSTDAIHWPQFVLEKNASSPGLIFADSTLPGQVDYKACKLWSKVYDLIEADNSTATATATSTGMATGTATPISGSGKPTASPPATPPANGAATSMPATGGFLALSLLLTVVVA